MLLRRTLLIAALALAAQPALAHKSGGLHLYNGTLTVEGAQAFAAFEIHAGSKADALVRVATDVAAEVVIARADGKPVTRLPIAAKSDVKVSRSGSQVRLSGLKRALKPGERIPLRLTFEGAGARTVLVRVIAN